MPRKLIKKIPYKYVHLSDKDIRDYLDRELDNPDFRNNCLEVSNQLKISVDIVEQVLKDKAFQMLKLLQKKALEKKRVKLRVFGYLSFEVLKKSLNTKFIKL